MSPDPLERRKVLMSDPTKLTRPRRRHATATTHAGRQAAVRADNFTYYKFWLAQGLSTRAATAATLAGCRSLRDLSRLGWQFFRHQENCGPRTLAELSDLVGGWPDAPPKRDAWLRRFSDDSLIEELQRRGIAVGCDGSTP
jgi:hypothetical protein